MLRTLSVALQSAVAGRNFASPFNPILVTESILSRDVGNTLTKCAANLFRVFVDRPRLQLSLFDTNASRTLTSENKSPHGVEGNETVIECGITANPAVVSEVHWLFNGKPVAKNSIKGNARAAIPVNRQQQRTLGARTITLPALFAATLVNTISFRPLEFTISNSRLVISPTRREHEGTYQCAAKNSEGTGRSNELLLKVHCESTGCFSRTVCAT